MMCPMFFCLNRGVLFFTFHIWDPYASTDEQEGDKILYLPNVLTQNQRAENTGKDGLGKLDDKELWKLTALDDPEPNAVADDGGTTDIGHDQ